MRISTSTYFFSRQNGVPTTMNIIKRSVCTHIIFRIFAVNPTSSAMKRSFARTGRVALSSPAMKRAASALKNALTVMAGRSSSFIPSSTKLNNVMNRNASRDSNALFFIPLKTRELSQRMSVIWIFCLHQRSVYLSAHSSRTWMICTSKITSIISRN